MHHQMPPGWGGAPQPMNGHELQIGSALGQLLAHNAQQTRVLEKISDRLDGLPMDIASALPKPPPSRPRDPLSFRDWMHLVAAAAIVVMALLGKLTGAQVIEGLQKLAGM